MKNGSMSGDPGNGNLPPEPMNRIVTLGASNLTLSLRTIIQLLQHRCGQPSEVLVAAGHGRSYGQFSQVLIRGLPGITASGLWSHLESANILPTYAFLTDIGNDIPYGYMPEQILEWVAWCVEQLQKQDAHIVITNIPMTSIESLSTRRFTIIRSLLFPFSQLSKPELINRAKEVHGGLIDMASSKNFKLYEQESAWFGPDGIHVLYWKRKELYRRVFEQLPLSRGEREPAADTAPRFLAWKQRPQFAYKKVLGREQRHQQPSGLLVDGTTVSMY